MSVTENKEAELYFSVSSDLTLVQEHRSKIERLFSVTLLLDVKPSTNNSHWIGVKGDSRDRLNAKIYILSLVKCPNSFCTEEKKIYLPPEVDADFIETIERRTKAVIICENRAKRLYLVRGSTLSVTAALTAIDEVIERDSLRHYEEFTPKRSNKASRRLSCALQETLTKKNQRGNYVNASDAVKRAIASCLMEDPDKPTDDDDVILIEDDSDEDIEPIIIVDTDDDDDDGGGGDDDDDDDVIIIDTPKAIQDQTDESGDVFFNEKNNKPANSRSVEQLTKAFSDMETPLKSTDHCKKAKVAISPTTFNQSTNEGDNEVFSSYGKNCVKEKSVEQLTKAFSDMETPSKSTDHCKKAKVAISQITFYQPTNEDDKEVFSSYGKDGVKDKESRKKKKKHKSKRAKKQTASKIEDDTVGPVIVYGNAIVRKGQFKSKRAKKRTASKLEDDTAEPITVNGNLIVREGKVFFPEDDQNLSKRQRINSTVVKPHSNKDNLGETEVNGAENEAQLKCTGKEHTIPKVINSFPTQRVQPMSQPKNKINKADTVDEKTKSDSTEKRKGKKLFSDIVRDYLGIDDENPSHQPRVTTTRKEMSHSMKTGLVDGKIVMNSSQGKNQAIRVTESSSRDKVTVPPHTTSARSRNDLRYIVIDGSNVAMAHGIDKFSCKGIKICVDYFRKRGHANITVFLPHWRKCRPQDPTSVTYRYVLDDLEKDGYLVYTPSRRIGRKLVASYDDRFVIELAEREDGIVVSNDQYRDLLHEKHSWRRVIETRLLMFIFVRDHFMLPDDPYGKNGPSLDELLRQSTTKSAIPRERDMFSTLKCLEMNNPRCDTRETERDFYGYRTARY